MDSCSPSSPMLFLLLFLVDYKLVAVQCVHTFKTGLQPFDDEKGVLSILKVFMNNNNNNNNNNNSNNNKNYYFIRFCTFLATIYDLHAHKQAFKKVQILSLKAKLNLQEKALIQSQQGAEVISFDNILILMWFSFANVDSNFFEM